jgi:hypothetical protein
VGSSLSKSNLDFPDEGHGAERSGAVIPHPLNLCVVRHQSLHLLQHWPSLSMLSLSPPLRSLVHVHHQSFDQSWWWCGADRGSIVVDEVCGLITLILHIHWALSFWAFGPCTGCACMPGWCCMQRSLGACIWVSPHPSIISPPPSFTLHPSTLFWWCSGYHPGLTPLNLDISL